MKAQRTRGAQRKAVKQPTTGNGNFSQRFASALPWLLASVLLCVVLTGVIYLPRALDGYPIRSVQVEGVKDARRQQAVQLSLVETLNDENFFTVSLSDIYRQARQLEWVADVEVRRQWPDRLVISIEERVPVAVWNEDLLVSNSGKPFRALNKYSLESLPKLFGPSERMPAVLDYYHSMSKVLAPVGRKIQRLDVDARLTARLQLDDGVKLVVDREDYAKKLRRFVNLYDDVLVSDSRGLAQVDLRYADGMAVQWREPEATQSASKRS
ncbi:MAG: cell division protein FtsQ/DivIB [Alcanivoracaceae bacterium]|nr:cell division protein FtsQ/DivIB [Alcanivoracaceae bacterium]